MWARPATEITGLFSRDRISYFALGLLFGYSCKWRCGGPIAVLRERFAVDINCLEMGAGCDQIVSGESTLELVEAVRGHIRLAHGYDEAELTSQDMTEMISGAIWQSCRPPELRTPRPDV